MTTKDCRTIPNLSPLQLQHFWEKVQKTDTCWLWTGARLANGYPVLTLYDIVYYAHRVSWCIHHGDPGNHQVLHRCDVPNCINPHHLFLGTQRDNMQDCKNKGRSSQPPHKYKLTEAQVQTIKQIHAAGLMGYRLLGQAYNVDRTTIRNIIKGRRWKHI
jgi:hypothetical protein